MKIENKVLRFYCALTDVYKDEDEREMIGAPSLELSGEDITEDVTAMMLAIKLFIEKTCGDETGDPIDFTHTLNKLAIQYVMMEAKNGKTDI